MTTTTVMMMAMMGVMGVVELGAGRTIVTMMRKMIVTMLVSDHLMENIKKLYEFVIVIVSEKQRLIYIILTMYTANFHYVARVDEEPLHTTVGRNLFAVLQGLCESAARCVDYRMIQVLQK